MEYQIDAGYAMSPGFGISPVKKSPVVPKPPLFPKEPLEFTSPLQNPFVSPSKNPFPDFDRAFAEGEVVDSSDEDATFDPSKTVEAMAVAPGKQFEEAEKETLQRQAVNYNQECQDAREEDRCETFFRDATASNVLATPIRVQNKPEAVGNPVGPLIDSFDLESTDKRTKSKAAEEEESSESEPVVALYDQLAELDSKTSKPRSSYKTPTRGSDRKRLPISTPGLSPIHSACEESPAFTASPVFSSSAVRPQQPGPQQREKDAPEVEEVTRSLFSEDGEGKPTVQGRPLSAPPLRHAVAGGEGGAPPEQSAQSTTLPVEDVANAWECFTLAVKAAQAAAKTVCRIASREAQEWKTVSRSRFPVPALSSPQEAFRQTRPRDKEEPAEPSVSFEASDWRPISMLASPGHRPRAGLSEGTSFAAEEPSFFQSRASERPSFLDPEGVSQLRTPVPSKPYRSVGIPFSEPLQERWRTAPRPARAPRWDLPQTLTPLPIGRGLREFGSRYWRDRLGMYPTGQEGLHRAPISPLR